MQRIPLLKPSSHASSPSKILFPQTGSGKGQTPQSASHVEQVSSPLHVASPQYGSGGGQAPQSTSHVVHVSSPLHVASPQYSPVSVSNKHSEVHQSQVPP